MNIIDDLLEKACKNMITTILSCLEVATKGTIYKVGPMPDLRAVRVTSGMRKEGDGEIGWDLPSVSDYNYPGKTWTQYRDQPDHVLEAMGWCVEKQVSWTAENPFEDVRSVRKQLRGEIEDCYHMEPVLVRKGDLYGNCLESLEYPIDWLGKPIWQDSTYVVVAVIKIHFLPFSVRRDDRSTRLIKELSRTLGTELLTLYLRESLYHSQKEFTRQRLQSCEILAHELRNALIKFGFVSSAINAQIAILREEWELQVRKAFPHLRWKSSILERLNELVDIGNPQIDRGVEIFRVCMALLREQRELAKLPLLPTQAEQWLKNKIRPKWERLLGASGPWEKHRGEVIGLLDDLTSAFNLGTDPVLSEKLRHLPPELRERWVRLAYVHFTPEKADLLNEILEFLDNPQLPIPFKEQLRKALKSLKVLVDVIPEVEERANRIILSLRYGTMEDDPTVMNPLRSQYCIDALTPSAEKGTSFVE
jgi:hypothetical protein